MMTIRTLALVLLCLSVGGCGGHNWKHATLPAESWDADYADCLNRAETEAGGIRVKDPATLPAKEGEIRYLIEKCMQARGYYHP